MTDQDLTDAEAEVLRAVDRDGIEVFQYFTPDQKSLVDTLQDDGLIHAFGDEYDYNYYLTRNGKVTLEEYDDEHK